MMKDMYMSDINKQRDADDGGGNVDDAHILTMDMTRRSYRRRYQGRYIFRPRRFRLVEDTFITRSIFSVWALGPE